MVDEYTPSKEVIESLRADFGLDEFQAPAAAHFTGPALVLAAAGSGKTTCLTARVCHLVQHHDIPPEEILCITFTNKATDNMMSKISKRLGQSILPTISTIHSLGLSIIRHYPKQALAAQASLAELPYDPSDESSLTTWSDRNCDTAFRKLCEGSDIKGLASDLLDKILYLTNRGYRPSTYEALLTKADPVLDTEREKLDLAEVGLWKDYWKTKYMNRAIDFQDMMLLANVILENNSYIQQSYHRKWRFILQDEAQDASPLQWKLLDLLTGYENNLFCVGDSSQCHPAGTMITVTTDPTSKTTRLPKKPLQDIFNSFLIKRGLSIKSFSQEFNTTLSAAYSYARGSLPPKDLFNQIAPDLQETYNLYLEDKSQASYRGGSMKVTSFQKPIEDIVSGDNAVAWVRSEQRTYNRGREILVASHNYTGDMLTLSCASGDILSLTPEHQVWVRLNKDCLGKFCLYLMYKPGVGFRVGISNFGKSSLRFGLSSRVFQEGALCAWVLNVYSSKTEADLWEKIYSCKYGIPHSIFKVYKSPSQKNMLSQDNIDLLFSELDTMSGGHTCLKDHGLLFEYPLHTYTSQGAGDHYVRSNGYFKTAAANVMPKYMDLPLKGINKSTQLIFKESHPYTGLVYSLDVDIHHTYLANNLVVGNCIMGFNGADVKTFMAFRDGFRGSKTQLYPLLNNYRSHHTIIDVANTLEGEVIGNHPAPMIAKASVSATRTLSYIEYADSEEEANHIASTIIKLAPVPKYEKFQAFMNTPKLPLGVPRPRISAPQQIAPQAKEKPFKLRDIVILVRTKLMIPTIENALLMKHIPYYVKDGKSLLQTKEVADLLAYLRLLVNPYDTVSFERAVQVPKRGFGGESIKKLVAQSMETRDSVVSLMNKVPKLSLFCSLIDALGRKLKDNPGGIEDHIKFWMDSLNYTDEIRKVSRDTEDQARRLENIKRFSNLVKSIIDEGALTDLPDILDHITLMQDAGLASTDDDKVHLMTAHSSKGLEYQVVFAPGFFEGAIPHYRSIKYPEELAEEARLAYVIFTRAIQQLRISRPLYYASRGSTVKSSTSRSRFFDPVKSFFSDPTLKLPQ